jgi:DNA/RNA endonuclease G (NUC1)
MTSAKGCAYIYTNESHSGNYSQGITTIDAIEERAGFDFFANVPAALQTAAEKSSKSIW